MCKSVQGFAAMEALVENSRRHFDAGPQLKKSEFVRVFNLLTAVLQSIGHLRSPEQMKDTQQEAAVSVLSQALETVCATYFLTREGYWIQALALTRNYSELILVAMAIGYDADCFTEWKHERKSFSSFDKILARVEASHKIPASEKEMLPFLKEYWGKSSQQFSHQLRRSSVRTTVRDGQVRIEPKVADYSFQNARLNVLRNMLLNVLSILLGVMDYGELCRRANRRFPQGAALIAEANECFQNPVWKSEDFA